MKMLDPCPVQTSLYSFTDLEVTQAAFFNILQNQLYNFQLRIQTETSNNNNKIILKMNYVKQYFVN